jgi:uncharacterized protein (DUF58 family)
LSKRLIDTNRRNVLTACLIGLAISAALFQDLIIFIAFLTVLGIILEDWLWTLIVTEKRSIWFQFTSDPAIESSGERPEPFTYSDNLYTDERSELEFYLLRRVASGSLTITSDSDSLEFRPARIASKEKVTRIRAVFKTHFSGDYNFRNVSFEIQSPLKLFKRKFSYSIDLNFTVFPRTIEVALESARLFAKAGIGETPTEKPGIGTEFYELRKYSPGDDYRLINWRASARAGEFIVNEKMREVAGAYYIVLDTRAPSYYDRDRLSAAFLQLANALVNLNTRFGFVVHDGKSIKTFSELDYPQNTLATALASALELIDASHSPHARPTYALSELREELMAVPSYKLRSSQKWLASRGYVLLSQIERTADLQLRKLTDFSKDPDSAVLNIVRESSYETKPPSIVYVSGLFGPMSNIVQIASEIKRIYNSEFVLANPTAPWIVAPDESAAYDAFVLRKKNLRVLASSDIEYHVGDPLAITKGLFGSV